MRPTFLTVSVLAMGLIAHAEHKKPAETAHPVAPVIGIDSANDTVSLLSGFEKTGKLSEKWSWSRVAKLLASSDPGLFCPQKEALEILRALPTIQQRIYELSVDENAKGAFATAQESDDREAMLAVATCYPTHPYGKKAMDWLGTYFLNRGAFEYSYPFYQELTRGKEAKTADEKIWVKAALAAHQVGDAKLRDAALEVLKDRQARIRVGEETLDADGLEKEVLKVDAKGRKHPGEAPSGFIKALQEPYASPGFDSHLARWVARHSTALLEDAASQLANPRKFLSVGDSEFCTLSTAKEVTCFSGGEDQPKRGFKMPIQQLASLSGHHCVLLSDGTVWCWETNARAPAKEIKGLSGTKEISGRGTSLCAVHGDALKVSCAWMSSVVPPRIWPAGYSSLKQISSFDELGCGIESKSGELRCWDKRTRTPSEFCRPPKRKNLSQVAVGNGFACALADGKPVCWGDKEAVASVPAGLRDITSLTLGNTHYCALTKQEEVICWGDRRPQFRPPKGLKGVRRISTSDWITCADTRNQGVVCWGFTQGQLLSRSAAALQRDYFLNQIRACEKRR